LGLPQRVAIDEAFDTIFLFYYDSPNAEREKNMAKMKEMLGKKGQIIEVPTEEYNPTPAINSFYNLVKEKLRKSGGDVILNLDITTFTKIHLMLILKTIDDLEIWENLRIFYTEPRDYNVDLYLPMSKGLSEIARIDNFVSSSSPTLSKLLVVFLGYEGDRAKAIYENEEPNDIVLVIPKPAYHKEWEDRTENMNQMLIRMVGEEKIRFAHSLNPLLVSLTLKKLLSDFPFEKWRWSVVPLGTKPQSVGLYMFWRENKDLFSIIYAPPLKHNYDFYSKGIGKTWLLKDTKKR
jgi:hypothetical protein